MKTKSKKMKTFGRFIYLSILLSISSLTCFGQFNSVFKATFVDNNTPNNLDVGNNIDLNINIDNLGPGHCGLIPNGYPFSIHQLAFNVNYILVNTSTQEQFNLLTEDYSFYLSDGQLWSVNGNINQLIPITQCIPTGNLN
jgi:hypothetical protein